MAKKRLGKDVIARDKRIERASVIIKAHPKWGRDVINEQLKGEFGIGLRKVFVDKLKRETLGKPPRRILTRETEYTTKPPRIPFFVDIPALSPKKQAKKTKIAIPIHQIGSRVCECYVVIELVVPVSSQGVETRFITIFLGENSYTSFLARLRSGVFRRRIDRVMRNIWGVEAEGWRIVGYWAHRYSRAERRARVRVKGRKAAKPRWKGY